MVQGRFDQRVGLLRLPELQVGVDHALGRPDRQGLDHRWIGEGSAHELQRLLGALFEHQPFHELHLPIPEVRVCLDLGVTVGETELGVARQVCVVVVRFSVIRIFLSVFADAAGLLLYGPDLEQALAVPEAAIG